MSLSNVDFDEPSIPVHSYEYYSTESLIDIHYFDQWTPIFALFYTLLILIIYLQQYCHRVKTFDPNIVPIHRIGILCLFVTLFYCVLLFINSHNIWKNIPYIKSCSNTQKLHLISLVILKYFTTWIFIFNLSYMNQSPYFNPRYKYISKKRRKFRYYFFLSLKWLIFIMLPIGCYSAYNRSQYNHFISKPNKFEYCYLTLSLRNFFILFGTDIAGIILYGILFGRNAFKLTRRSTKVNKKQKTINPSNINSYQKYDNDDPIQKGLLQNEQKHVENIDDMLLQNDSDCDDDIDSQSPSPSPTRTTSLSYSGSHSDNELLNQEVPRSRVSRVDCTPSRSQTHSRRSLHTSRESSVFSGAEDNVKLQEERGVRELVRVLRLIWFMFIFYWISLILWILFGLYTSTACLALIVNATCILLLNDYEFSSTYWSIRSDIMSVFCCCCITLCGFKYCGKRKYSLNTPRNQDCYMRYDDDTVYSVTKSRKKDDSYTDKRYHHQEIIIPNK